MAQLVQGKLGDIPMYSKGFQGRELHHIVRTMPWQAPSSWICPPIPVDLMAEGKVDVSAMVYKADAENSVKPLLSIRIIGSVAAIVGVAMVFIPLLDEEWVAYYAESVPLLRDCLHEAKRAVATYRSPRCAVWAAAVGVGLPSVVLAAVAIWYSIRPLLAVVFVLALVVCIRIYKAFCEKLKQG